MSLNIKISIGVFAIVMIWVLTGVFIKRDHTGEKPYAGKNKMVVLARAEEAKSVFKVITGYGRIDRGKVDVISELNSRVEEIYGNEGKIVKKGEPVIKMLHGVIIPSPIDGVLDSVDIEVGKIVFAGQTQLFSVVSRDKIDARLFVSSNDARFVKSGNEAEILVQDRKLKGKVHFISKVSEKTTNAFEVTIAINRSNLPDLFHDETAKIEINTVKRQGFFVPTASLSIDEDGKIILTFLNEEGIVQKQPVDILKTENTGLWVGSDALPKKILVVTRSGEFMEEGQTLEYKLEE